MIKVSETVHCSRDKMWNSMDKRALSDKTVLIVDDEPVVRHLIHRTILKTYPEWNVELASDGLEAKHKLLDLYPRLVITDICLPGIHGLELCQFIQEHPRLVHTRILAITGYHMPNIHEKVFNRGASEFLFKPFALDEFVGSIGRLLA